RRWSAHRPCSRSVAAVARSRQPPNMRCARDSAEQHDLARAVTQQGAELTGVEESSRSAGAYGVGVGDDGRDGHVLTGHEPVCGDLDQSWLSRLLAALTPLALGIDLRW